MPERKHNRHRPEAALAFSNRLDEVTALLAEAARMVEEFRERFPSLRAPDIIEHARDFDAAGREIGRRVSELRAAAFRLTGGRARLSEALANHPAPLKAKVRSSADGLKQAAERLKKQISSLGFVAGVQLLYLDALLRTVGEATGAEATYHPRKPAMRRVSMGIVDRTA